MSGYFRVQVSLDRDGGIPEDVIVNTLHFDSDQTFAEDADDVAGRVSTFYNAIASYLPGWLAGTGRIKVYDMADAEPRVPGINQALTFTPAPSEDTPAEVAVTLSLHAAVGSGDNPRRKRGRIFLPAGSSATRGAKVGGDVTVLDSARTAILTAAEALCTGPDAGDARLAVFSPTAAGALVNRQYTLEQLDTGFSDVVAVSMDNRFDIIRRRGSAPTNRTTVNVT